MEKPTVNALNFNILKKPMVPEIGQGVDAAAQSVRESQWPSRQSSEQHKQPMVQMTVRATLEVSNDFRDMCKRERYSYGEMLEILIKTYQARTL